MVKRQDSRIISLIIVALLALSLILVVGCTPKTGIPECDYQPRLPSGDADKVCQAVVYYNSETGLCETMGGGGGEECPENKFFPDREAYIDPCYMLDNSADVEYCVYKSESDILTLSLETCRQICENRTQG